MITKLATFRGVTGRGDPLVQVFRQGDSVTKVAGNLMPPIQDWLGTYKSDSSKIAILVNALGASEFWGQNVNGDIFPESALIHDCRCHAGEQHGTDDFTGKTIPPYGYWTFLQAFPYVHHRNKDPTRAFGKVVVTCWNPTMKRIELIVLIDRHLAMQHDAQHIVDRIDRGDYPDVSMGCRVPYDICTVCGNKSKTRNDYCSCIKNIGMGKILDDGRRIGVINTYPRFFDISFVFIGADKTAKMMCKLGSGLWVPQSVADAERAYCFEEDPNGLIKAACGRGSCAECQGKCKAAALTLLTGGMGSGKSTLADKVKGHYDVVVGGDVGHAEGGKWVAPPKEKKQAIRDQRAKAIIQAHRAGKKVLFEGDPTVITKYPGVAAEADRLVDLSVGDVRRAFRVAKRSFKRDSGLWEDFVQYRRENKRDVASRNTLRSILGKNYHALPPDAAEEALRKTAEPRIAGVSLEDSDKILAGLRGAALGAVTGHAPSDTALKAVRGAATRIGVSEVKKEVGGPLKVKGVPKRLSQKREAQMAEKLLKKISSERQKCLTRIVKLVKKDPSLKVMVGPPDSPYNSRHFWAETSSGRVVDPTSKSYEFYNKGKPLDLKKNPEVMKLASEQTRLTAEIYSEGTGEPTRHKRMAREVEDGQSKTMLERLAPPPPVSKTLYGKEDPQDDGAAARILTTNEDTPTDGVEDDAKLSSAPPYLPIPSPVPPILAGAALGGATALGSALIAMGPEGRKRLSKEVHDPRLYSNLRGMVTGESREDRVGAHKQLERGEQESVLDAMRSGFGRKKLSSAFKMGPPPSPNRENYPFVGTLNFRGLLIYVENAPGTWRTGTGWKTLMKVPYGEFAGSNGTDGDKLDVYVGPHRDCENVYIVHQNFAYGPKKGEYDEDKVMLGFRTPAQAKAMYLAHYDSPKFFRSITTMAFPLFKRAIMRGEVDGEKVAMEKTAESLRLEDLFDSATTDGTRRRERTWRDKTTNKETNVSGSGMGSWEKTKTAMWLPGRGSPRVVVDSDNGNIRVEDVILPLDSPAGQRALAAHHHEAVLGTVRNIDHSSLLSPYREASSKTASAKVYGPMDLYKLSMEDKEAAKRKWAEIIKEVGPSKAVGQTSPLLSASEPSIPREALNAMGAKGLESALATPSLMGMVLKPKEFQRIILVHMGEGDLANKLDDADAVFRPQMGESGPCSCLEPHQADTDLLKMLLPLLSQRSYFGPVVRRRIIRITAMKPKQEPLGQEVDSPLLSKVGSAYNWYRREQMKVAVSSLDRATAIPELHAAIHGLDDADLFKTAAAGRPDRTTAGMMLGSIPITLMYSAHLRSEQEKGNDVGTLGSFIADHPWLTSIAAVSGTRALMETPAVRKKVDEGLQRVGRAGSALSGN